MSPTAERQRIHVSVDGVATPLGRVKAQRIVEGVLRAERVRSALISIAFVEARTIAAMNRKHLRHEGETDVISFGLSRPTSRDWLVGDIYIAPDVARANAREQGIRVREELVRLLVHGTLHVLGYDHPVDHRRECSAMWKRQERLVARLSRTIATR